MSSNDMQAPLAARAGEKPRLAFLDALRGLAALYVVIYHIALMPDPHLAVPYWAEKFVLNGGTGVTLFFVVSAFSLYYTMPLRLRGAQPTLSFYLHRFFRIAPLFYVLLVLSILRDWILFDSGHSLTRVLASILFVFNFIPLEQEGIVWASWTIGVEMVFYAVFPLIYSRVRTLGGAVAFTFGSLLFWYGLGLVLEYVPMQPEWRGSILQVSTFKYFPVFAVGMMLYFWFMHASDKDRTSKGAAALLAGIYVFLAMVQGWLPNLFGNPSYWPAVSYALIFAGLALWPLKLFVNRFTAFIGKISYSLYLLHPTAVFLLIPVYRKIYAHTPTLTLAFFACAALTLCLLIPLSYLSYRWIELPGMRLGKRLESHLIRSRSEASVQG